MKKNIKKLLQKKLVETLEEAKTLQEQEQRAKEDEQMEKIQSAETGKPITLSGYGVIGPDGKDTGKRFIRKKDAEEYLKQSSRGNTETELDKIEEEIFNELMVWLKNTQNLTKKEIEDKITQKIKENNYLKEDWQIHYAKERIKDEIIKILKSKNSALEYGLNDRGDLKKFLGWRRHFACKNLIINVFISFIPFAITLGILRELGFGGALLILLLWALFIYLAGIIREKITFFIKEKQRIK